MTRTMRQGSTASWLIGGALLFAGACAGEILPDDPPPGDQPVEGASKSEVEQESAQLKVVSPLAQATPQEQAFRRDFCRDRSGPGWFDGVETCQYDTGEGGRLPPPNPPPIKPLRFVCVEQFYHRNQIWAKNDTNSNAVLAQDGHPWGPITIAPGGSAVLSGFRGPGPVVCLSTRGKGGLGLSRHTLFDIPQ